MPPYIALEARQQRAPVPDVAYCTESNKLEILAISSVFFALATVINLLRLHLRFFITKSFGWDDHVMLTAWLMALGTFICFVGETHYAIGKHISCVPPGDYEMYFKWQYFHSIWVMIGVVLVKISVALFLMRLVPPGVNWKRCLWALIVFLICFCIACLGTLVFACVPIDASWNSALRARPSTHCFSYQTYSAIGLMNSSINCTTDFLLALAPIPIILKLHVNRRTKASLALILSLGYFACAAGIVKAVSQHGFFSQKDPLWHDSFNVWNMIELCVGIVAGSLPALRPLFTKLLESTRTVLSAGSWASRRRSVIGAVGYRRQKSRDGVVHHNDKANSDIKLQEWKNGTNGTDTTTLISTTKTFASLDVEEVLAPSRSLG